MSARERLAAERAAAAGRLAALEREFGGIVEAARSANADDEHDPEGATIAFERQHVAALIAQARDRLTEIDDALRRLADGSYGTCARCGGPIPPERLAARPAASACMACAARRLLDQRGGTATPVRRDVPEPAIRPALHTRQRGQAILGRPALQAGRRALRRSPLSRCGRPAPATPGTSADLCRGGLASRRRRDAELADRHRGVAAGVGVGDGLDRVPAGRIEPEVLGA